MTNAASPADPVQSYVSALRATAEMEAPYGAALFTILTSLVRVHELVHPTTTVTNTLLLVDGGTLLGGPYRGRKLPLSNVTSRLLADRAPGSLTSCLGLEAPSLPRFEHDLSLALLDHDLAAFAAPAQAWGNAVHALIAAADDSDQRAAVFAYSGIYPSQVRARDRVQIVGPDGLVRVARLIDQMAAEAGFAFPCDATTRVA